MVQRVVGPDGLAAIVVDEVRAVAGVVVAVAGMSTVTVDGVGQAIEVVVVAGFGAQAAAGGFDDGRDIAVAVIGAGGGLDFRFRRADIGRYGRTVQCVVVGPGDPAVGRFAADTVVVAVVAPDPACTTGVGLALEPVAFVVGEGGDGGTDRLLKGGRSRIPPT